MWPFPIAHLNTKWNITKYNNIEMYTIRNNSVKNNQIYTRKYCEIRRNLISNKRSEKKEEVFFSLRLKLKIIDELVLMSHYLMVKANRTWNDIYQLIDAGGMHVGQWKQAKINE